MCGNHPGGLPTQPVCRAEGDVVDVMPRCEPRLLMVDLPVADEHVEPSSRMTARADAVVVAAEMRPTTVHELEARPSASTRREGRAPARRDRLRRRNRRADSTLNPGPMPRLRPAMKIDLPGMSKTRVGMTRNGPPAA
jgi:hypothetical protein